MSFMTREEGNLLVWNSHVTLTRMITGRQNCVEMEEECDRLECLFC